MSAPEVRLHERIADIDAGLWDSCANSDGEFNPFLSHAFLKALEDSGSVGGRSGWRPMHVEVRQNQALIGFVPLYAKGHSQGEYVFDHNWADAYQRAGGRYYPKLQCSVPFTPATGRRVLPVRDEAGLEATLFTALAAVLEQTELSSLHVTFMTESQWNRAGGKGYLQRIDQQFHWHNRGYASFEDFLAELTSKKRKDLRRERRDALASGIEVEWVTGNDLTEAHWDAFFQFYMDTGSRKWGSPYLTREFFSEINRTFAAHTLLILCKREGRYIAGALNFIGSQTLYGRNWGCTEYHPFLHFETCYYQAIDFAISRGLQRVEAGAQGQHKIARGYEPQATWSAHWIRDEGFRDAVARYLVRERQHVQADIEWVAEHLPFRQETSGDGSAT
ncbi:MAG: N-acetyltransferase [Gammaproteobacteria bacterium]|nr:N-acetyltransferase [Gammaproteobacteria bacterium]